MFGWFKRLKVGHKLALISIFFMVPDSVLLCLFLFSINGYINFAQLEKHGNEYQQPLEDLLNQIPEHMVLLLSAPDGDEPEIARLRGVQAQIDATFHRLEAVDDRLGVALQFTQEGLSKRNREHCKVRVVRQEWQDVKDQLDSLQPAHAVGCHLHLIADVRTMITHCGDTSNLILDPDLDSYYLMDVTLLGLPQLQDRLIRVLTYGMSVLEEHDISDDERTQLNLYAGLLQEADLDRIVTSTRTALNEDANFYGTSESLQLRVPAALEEFQAAVSTFISLTRRLGDSQLAKPEKTEFLSAEQRVRQASTALWNVTRQELDLLLQKRIDAYRTRRSRSLLLTVLALAAAVGFVSFITRSISGPLQRQAATLRQTVEALQAEVLERQRAEGSARQAEEKYRSIFENSVEGIYQAAPDGRFLVANERLAHMFGYESAAELLGLPDARIPYVDPGRREEFRRLVEEKGTVRGFESQAVRRDGAIIWITESARAERDPNGATLHCESMVEDVTERKKTEAELERVHKELLHASRAAGMAEIATGVLHNVGNVLNSINVSVNVLTELLTQSKRANLSKLALLLHQHETDLASFLVTDPKGKRVPDYLAQLAEQIDAERVKQLREADLLRKNVDHVKDIVAMQQSYARVSGVTETVDVVDLVEDALRINGSSFERSGVRVNREYERVPATHVDRHKMLQILVNVFRNAKTACDDMNRKDKQVTIRLCNGDGRVRISVIDNGVGIPPDNLTRIFAHGFTTRKNGHGFGLHYSALAAKEMGGSLSAHSDGVGKGATFTLELPCRTD